ncbi:MAG: hypothetical protein R3300_11185 [Candidatus Promineifilaceae bacterium]|nr:hypothetical protein [Candidatus Promineifilaceae bacterium]
MKPNPTRVLVLILAVLLAVTAIWVGGGRLAAQSGGAYDLSWSALGGGGGTFSQGGDYLLGGTVGQPGAGRQSGGAYQLEGGFWHCFPLAFDPCAAAEGDHFIYLPSLMRPEN